MTAQEKIQKALEFALANRPSVGGFPFLAECLRRVGVAHNIWTLPAVQSMYMMIDGDCVVNQGMPLVTGVVAVPMFDTQALATALRADQSGQSAFPEFLLAIWQAGVWGYDVDFEKRTVTYLGAKGGMYTESYPTVEIPELTFDRYS